MLNGINILDISTLLPGPRAAAKLSELGANVTKIEPIGGDPLKNFPAQYIGQLYKTLNHDKKIFELDLIHDREKVLEIVSCSDVVISNFRPGFLENLNLGFTDLKKCNPTIIQVNLVAYKENDHPGHDLNFLAESGLLSQLPGGLPNLQIIDAMGAMEIVIQVLNALIELQNSNQAKFIKRMFKRIKFDSL